MSEKSNQFEQMIARIHELLEDQEADVLWNETIPDPDNPQQPRQIDVLIKKDAMVNIIECRFHKGKQNVKWIEELIGRRTSLNANSVVAVSASGFTSGAIKKANKYGIILNDLLSITDDEIISWANSIKITLYFYRYDKFDLFLYFDSKDIGQIDPEIVLHELKGHHGLLSLLNESHKVIDSQNLIIEDNRNKEVQFKLRLKNDDFYLQGKEVKEVEVKVKAGLEIINLNVPMILAYGDPNTRKEDRNVYVQKFNLGQTDIVYHDDKISICLDLSKLDVPTLWQFRFFEVAGQKEYYHEKLEVIEPLNMIMKIDRLRLSIGTIE
jgi:hypothetical protein